jgi:hypothetical protein
MHAPKPLPTLDECVVKSAQLEAETRERLAKLQFTLDSMTCLIKASANAIAASQALLANLPVHESSN